jgi:hypothetical protein
VTAKSRGRVVEGSLRLTAVGRRLHRRGQLPYYTRYKEARGRDFVCGRDRHKDIEEMTLRVEPSSRARTLASACGRWRIANSVRVEAIPNTRATLRTDGAESNGAGCPRLLRDAL